MSPFAAERLVGISFVVVGLSHLFRPREWAAFFAMLLARGAPGAFVNGMLSLSFGAVVVALHGARWDGWAAGVVTVVGWGQVLKGLVNLCFPAVGLRSMAQVPAERAWKFAAAGALMAPLGGALLATTFR